MTFLEIIEALKNANTKARRRDWPAEMYLERYLLVSLQGALPFWNNNLRIYLPVPAHFSYSPSLEDIMATDWEVL